MQLPQMTTRRWMLIVMVVALLLAGAELMRRRSRHFQERAAFHQRESSKWHDNDLFLFLVLTPTQLGENPPPDLVKRVQKQEEEWRQAARPWTTFIEYHARLVEKYKVAARSPWFPVSPDPPSPPAPPRKLEDAFKDRVLARDPDAQDLFEAKSVPRR